MGAIETRINPECEKETPVYSEERFKRFFAVVAHCLSTVLNIEQKI